MQVDVKQFYLLQKSYTVYQKQVIKTIGILTLLDYNASLGPCSEYHRVVLKNLDSADLIITRNILQTQILELTPN